MVVKTKILIGAAGALCLALLPLPYAYYVLLRIGMFGVLAYLAFCEWHTRRQGLAWVIGVAAAVYNPFVPLHLGRELWTVINLVTLWLLWSVRPGSGPSNTASRGE